MQTAEKELRRWRRRLALMATGKRLMIPPFPPIVSARDLAKHLPPRQIELVKGILHQGEKMVLGGSSKTNKTWSSLDLAVSVAAGVEWLGRATTKSKVLYINFEIQPYHFGKRVERVVEAKGLTEIPANLFVWNLRGHACHAGYLVEEAIDRLTGEDYGLVIIDPLYKMLGDCNENEAGGMAHICNQLERLAMATGAAVMFDAHFSKGNQAGKAPMDRIGGSGVLGRDPDSILTITQHKDDNVYVLDATLRNFPPIPSFGLRWEYPLMVLDADVDPTRLRKAGRNSVYNETHLMTSLLPEGMTYGAWRDAVMSTTGMSETTFKTLKRNLEKMNKVELVSKLYRAAPDWGAPPAA